MNQGEAVLFIRVWSGKTCQSPQREFLRLEKAGLQKLAKRTYSGGAVEYCIVKDDGLNVVSQATPARRDGLSFDDIGTWFRDYPEAIWP